MKLKKTLSNSIAILCIAQMCLLLFASVSPQVHTWAFHGKQLTDTTCSDTHTTCSKSPDPVEKQDSQLPESESSNELCPVVLFELGVRNLDEPIFQLLVTRPVVGLITTRSTTIQTSHSRSLRWARAPPAA